MASSFYPHVDGDVDQIGIDGSIILNRGDSIIRGEDILYIMEHCFDRKFDLEGVAPTRPRFNRTLDAIGDLAGRFDEVAGYDWAKDDILAKDSHRGIEFTGGRIPFTSVTGAFSDFDSLIPIQKISGTPLYPSSSLRKECIVHMEREIKKMERLVVDGTYGGIHIIVAGNDYPWDGLIQSRRVDTQDGRVVSDTTDDGTLAFYQFEEKSGTTGRHSKNTLTLINFSKYLEKVSAWNRQQTLWLSRLGANYDTREYYVYFVYDLAYRRYHKSKNASAPDIDVSRMFAGITGFSVRYYSDTIQLNNFANRMAGAFDSFGLDMSFPDWSEPGDESQVSGSINLLGCGGLSVIYT